MTEYKSYDDLTSTGSLLEVIKFLKDDGMDAEDIVRRARENVKDRHNSEKLHRKDLVSFVESEKDTVVLDADNHWRGSRSKLLTYSDLFKEKILIVLFGGFLIFVASMLVGSIVAEVFGQEKLIVATIVVAVLVISHMLTEQSLDIQLDKENRVRDAFRDGMVAEARLRRITEYEKAMDKIHPRRHDSF